MDSKKRIDRLCLMITFAVMKATSDLPVELEDEGKWLLIKVFEKAKAEVEAYEKSIERYKIEPSNN